MTGLAMPAAVAPASGVRWRAAVALALVFLAGGGVGWALGDRFGDGPDRRGRGGGRGPRAGMLLDAGPIARYNLSPDQRRRIDSILGARRAEIDAFWQGPGQQLRGVLDATRADVRAVLTPAQQAAFDSARAEHQRRRGRRGPPFGPPGPPGP